MPKKVIGMCQANTTDDKKCAIDQAAGTHRMRIPKSSYCGPNLIGQSRQSKYVSNERKVSKERKSVFREDQTYNFLNLCSLRCSIPYITDWRSYLLEERDIFQKRKRTVPIKVLSDQFQLIKIRKCTLGHAIFAKRFLCKGNVEVYKKYYIMKSFSKYEIINWDFLNCLRNEKDILSRINFSFISHIEFIYQDRTNVYFGYSFIAGKTLRNYLEQEGRLTEPLINFYSAQMVLALEYLHFLNIIHRNIKPENIVIGPNGYVKLTSFYKAKVVQDRTFTHCLNLEYAAPEVFTDYGYGKSVDWWALAVTMFELGTGFTPFETGHYTTTYKRIMSGNYKEPGHFTFELKHLLRRLLTVSIGVRAKTTLKSLDEIKSHKWFGKVNWTYLANRAVEPEFAPGLKNPLEEHVFLDYDDRYLKKYNVDRYQHEFKDF